MVVKGFGKSIWKLVSAAARYFWRQRWWFAAGMFFVVLIRFGFWSVSTEGLAWLGNGKDAPVTRSEVLRNLGLIAVSVIGVGLAVWRSMVAATNAQLAEQGHQNERYQTAAKMLGDEQLSVRLGGIYALDRLARDNPEIYRKTVMQLFCAFARNPPYIEKERLEQKEVGGEAGEKRGRPPELAREDVLEIANALGSLSRIEPGVLANLTGAKLVGADLEDGYLVGVYLWGADLRDANLRYANLTGAKLGGANLRVADLEGANLEGAYLGGADLEDGYFRAAILTEANLRNANLRNADLLGANLRGAILGGVKLPANIEIGEDGIAREKKPEQAKKEDPN